MRNNERPVEEERPPSMAAGELLQLRQRHTVSGLRYAHVLLASLKDVLNFSFHDVFFFLLFIGITFCMVPFSPDNRCILYLG